MKTIFIFSLFSSFLFGVSCKETIKYFNQGSSDIQLQEINLHCVDGYKFRVLSEVHTKKILEIEDNKYLNKRKLNENENEKN